MGTVGKEAGWGGGNPRGRGEGEKEQEELAPSLGLGEGWPVMGMGFGQNKGPSWIGRPFGNKVLALFYFPTKESAVSSTMESLTVEFGMGSGVPSPP